MIVFTSRVSKYPVPASAYSGISNFLNSSTKIGANLFPERNKITISLKVTFLYPFIFLS